MNTNTSARLEDSQADSLRGFWQANTAAGAIALGAVAFLVVMRGVFRTRLGG